MMPASLSQNYFSSAVITVLGAKGTARVDSERATEGSWQQGSLTSAAVKSQAVLVVLSSIDRLLPKNLVDRDEFCGSSLHLLHARDHFREKFRRLLWPTVE